MAGFRFVAAIALVLASAATANAQPWPLVGWVTAHVGAANGGDVRDPGITPGMSLAVVEKSGIGAELDIAYVSTFDPERFADSSVTSVFLNVIGSSKHPRYKPFVVAGIGIMRVRADVFEDVTGTTRTDLGWNAGGGFMFLVNEAFGLRGDARYFRYFQDHPDVPTLDGSTFDFWRISVGATYLWPIR